MVTQLEIGEVVDARTEGPVVVGAEIQLMAHDSSRGVVIVSGTVVVGKGQGKLPADGAQGIGIDAAQVGDGYAAGSGKGCRGAIGGLAEHDGAVDVGPGLHLHPHVGADPGLSG